MPRILDTKDLQRKRMAFDSANVPQSATGMLGKGAKKAAAPSRAEFHCDMGREETAIQSCFDQHGRRTQDAGSDLNHDCFRNSPVGTPRSNAHCAQELPRWPGQIREREGLDLCEELQRVKHLGT
ncbi:hypothetical protein FOPE_01061 [Fonsecaea pedrosoi]|nr:hypothetical protein FOPE_01061 [Fonsecaea pedrosoi]